MTFARPRPHANPSLRLIAFHHAGGSAAMYHPISAQLPEDWELLILDLPGRGKRFAEAPINNTPEKTATVISIEATICRVKYVCRVFTRLHRRHH